MSRSTTEKALRVAHRFCKGYRAPAGDLAGVQLNVTERSQKGIPPDSSISEKGTGGNKELPLGLPSSHPEGRTNYISQPSFQTPGQTSGGGGMMLRTPSQEGEEYGHPSKTPPAGQLGPRRTMEGKRQTKQRGRAKQKSKQSYRKNRHKAKMRAKRRYKVMKNKPAFKRKQMLRRRFPLKFKRKVGETFTAPNMAFLIGKDQELGYVRSVSPMTGMVTFHVGGYWKSFPLQVFLCGTVFLSEDDIELFFDLVDREMGIDAWEEPDPASIRASADLFGIDWEEGDKFSDLCEKLTGRKELEDMTSANLLTIDKALVDGYFEDESADNEPYRGPEDLPSVTVDEEGKTAGGDSWFREEMAPDKLPVHEKPSSVPTMRHTPGSGQIVQISGQPGSYGEDLDPAQKVDRGQVVNAPGSARVIPHGHGFVNKQAAAKISEILENTESSIHERAQGIPIKLLRVDSKNNAWLYKAGKYRVRVRAYPKGNMTRVLKSDVKVSCSCPAWRWQGPEYWSKGVGYQRGKLQGTASVPIIRDPNAEHWACKHAVAVLKELESQYIPRKRAARKTPASSFAVRVALESLPKGVKVALRDARHLLASMGHLHLWAGVRREILGTIMPRNR